MLKQFSQGFALPSAVARACEGNRENRSTTLTYCVSAFSPLFQRRKILNMIILEVMKPGYQYKVFVCANREQERDGVDLKRV